MGQTIQSTYSPPSVRQLSRMGNRMQPLWGLADNKQCDPAGSTRLNVSIQVRRTKKPINEVTCYWSKMVIDIMIFWHLKVRFGRVQTGSAKYCHPLNSEPDHRSSSATDLNSEPDHQSSSATDLNF